MLRFTKGFRSIAVLGLTVVVGILAVGRLGQFDYSSILKSREAVLKENLLRTRAAIRQYAANQGAFPLDLQALVDWHYLRALPFDPVTQSSETWLVAYAALSEKDISLEPGVFDLFSGADGVALDGTRYSEW